MFLKKIFLLVLTVLLALSADLQFAKDPEALCLDGTQGVNKIINFNFSPIIYSLALVQESINGSFSLKVEIGLEEQT